MKISAEKRRIVVSCLEISCFGMSNHEFTVQVAGRSREAIAQEILKMHAQVFKLVLETKIDDPKMIVS